MRTLFTYKAHITWHLHIYVMPTGSNRFQTPDSLLLYPMGVTDKAMLASVSIIYKQRSRIRWLAKGVVQEKR